ncbi:hypothetical protein PsYK624_108050 [Phanerochaete sordida]|uniref:Uncharacterized protein n=1 Tax=Phanerochaete sordida TaxID=48140 RepID=A0A9P3GHZ2_9APHY|nr:hypothetical protein PsYK624_108050 [Phanerochaete sordida]
MHRNLASLHVGECNMCTTPRRAMSPHTVPRSLQHENTPFKPERRLPCAGIHNRSCEVPVHICRWFRIP